MNKSNAVPKIHSLFLTVACKSSRSAPPSDHYLPGLGPLKNHSSITTIGDLGFALLYHQCHGSETHPARTGFIWI